VVIVDDHLALLAVAGASLDLGAPGPVATTTGFQFRLARAIADSARSGRLSRELEDPAAALRRVLSPPAHRLLVLDPRVSMAEAVDVAVADRANFLFAELVGAALSYRAAVRVAVGNVGRAWPAVMRTHDIDFRAIEPS
jgi:hypothetical protein